MGQGISRRVIVAGGAAIAATTGARSTAGAEPESTTRFGFGWVRDLPDISDEQHAPTAPSNSGAPLPPPPPSADLTSRFPEPYNQGGLGSCTANAIAAAVQYARRKSGKTPDFVPSRLFIYYNERNAENTLALDKGAQIRTGIRSIVELGVCDERAWPYNYVAGDEVTGVFPAGAAAVKAPDRSVFDAAYNYRTISYQKLDQSSEGLERCLADGYPFAFGFRVYSNFTTNTTLLKKPDLGDKATQYGHAVLVVGYDRDRRVFRVRNSWGTSNNDHGYFDMDYDYVLSPALSSDFWVVYDTNAITL